MLITHLRDHHSPFLLVHALIVQLLPHQNLAIRHASYPAHNAKATCGQLLQHAIKFDPVEIVRWREPLLCAIMRDGEFAKACPCCVVGPSPRDAHVREALPMEFFSFSFAIRVCISARERNVYCRILTLNCQLTVFVLACALHTSGEASDVTSKKRSGERDRSFGSRSREALGKINRNHKMTVT
jgi:hypothetical protein